MEDSAPETARFCTGQRCWNAVLHCNIAIATPLFFMPLLKNAATQKYRLNRYYEHVLLIARDGLRSCCDTAISISQ
jgi:hypothetical protein